METQQIEITELNIFPVKSLGGIKLTESRLKTSGLEFDRNWMITDENFNFVTQRQIPEMAKIRVSISQNHLMLDADRISPLEIDLSLNESNKIETKVWNSPCKGFDEGKNSANWLNEVLGKFNNKNLKLIRFDKNFIREVDPKHLKGENSHTAFADAFPFLITSVESLELLNSHLIKKNCEPVNMDRFRANIVIKNVKPFDEHYFESIEETEKKYSFGLRRACKRCKIITIDQQTGEIQNPKEPLATLAEINPLKDEKGIYFGERSTLLKGENQVIRIGDKLEFKK